MVYLGLAALGFVMAFIVDLTLELIMPEKKS